MLDEMTDTALIDYVLDDGDSTERELELADRLRRATDELARLVQEIARMEAARGTDSGG